MSWITYGSGVYAPDGPEERLGTYICDWPGCRQEADYGHWCEEHAQVIEEEEQEMDQREWYILWLERLAADIHKLQHNVDVDPVMITRGLSDLKTHVDQAFDTHMRRIKEEERDAAAR